MKRTKQKGSREEDWQERVARLEQQWREFVARIQAKLDSGRPLTLDDKWHLRDLLMEYWRGVGIRKAETWHVRQWNAFKKRLETKLSKWEAKEKRGELFTLEEFRDQVETFGGCIVQGDRETREMTAEQRRRITKRQAKLRESAQALNHQQDPAFQYARDRLGMEFLASPVRERQRDAWLQGFWHAKGKLTEKRPCEMGSNVTDGKPTVASDIDPIEKIHHDLHLENVTAERFHQAEEFIRACECVALWRLKQSRLPDDASHYLADLATRVAETVRTLTEARDIMLARRLPPIVKVMQAAERVFGNKLTNSADEIPIEKLLKKHRPIELIQTLAALHSDWAELCGIDDGEQFLKRPEEELRQVLLSEETWSGPRNGSKFEEKRKHRLAQLIEQLYKIREMQQRNVNLFVEHLWQGRLWSGPNGTYQDCEWPTHPPREDVSEWMRLIMSFLKKVTNNDPMKLSVFREVIAGRSFWYDGKRYNIAEGTRLRAAPSSEIWNQVGAEIRKAWKRMEKQARKPVLKNSA